MVFYKLDKYDKYFVAFILVILVIFNIGQCFAVEEENVDITRINNLTMVGTSNYFEYSPTQNLGSVAIEKGYVYTFHNTLNGSIYYAFSEDNPAEYVAYFDKGLCPPKSDYSFVANNNSYFYFSFQLDSSLKVTRHKIPGQESAINDLVENVGPQQLWSVFESGIDFVGIVVLVAFGLFLIYLLIKKLSKGKSDF